MADRTLVDWGLAGRTARTIAGRGDATPGAWIPEPRDVQRTCSEALDAAADYTGLEASEPPPAELIGRGEWAGVALATLGDASRAVEAQLAAQLSLPGPLGGAARRVAGAATGIEAGLAVGYAARRVLGQYDVTLVGTPRPARLLFVAPNLAAARSELGAAPASFLRWIALHETAHVLQFQGVPWLKGHLSSLVGELLDGAAESIELGDLARRLLRTDPRVLVRSVLQGELAEALVGDRQRATLERLQATMAAIEGHAEHVMDACGARDDPDVRALRLRLERRRRDRGGLGDAIARLLGLESKLRQYRLGKEFCDAIVREGGAGALNGLWSSVDSLPSLDELEAPRRWLERVGSGTPAAA